MTPYYDRAGITLHHGDCLAIIPTLGHFDLLLTDPPYGIGIAANPVRQAHQKRDWDKQPPPRALIDLAIGAADKAIVWGGNYFALPPHQCFLVWDKKQP